MGKGDFLTIKYSQLIVGINNISNEIPVRYSLYQNYPNPFNPVTKIKFDVPSDVRGQTSDVKLTVFDVLGKEVMTLVNEALAPGSYETEFEGSGFASGIYFYKLEAGSFVETKRMILIK
ncbi:MAG: T9SS type A sorting domain-containing protein [Ignavibacteria bacterium]|nr:T9SS type A sorting domain-containing protein [Ignavibacteria bacterium]